MRQPRPRRERGRSRGYSATASYFGKGATVQVMVDRYREQVNPTCRAYSVNLAGYGQSQLWPGDTRSHLLSGWSDKIVDLIRELESGEPVHAIDGATGAVTTEPLAVPVIEVLRSRYAR